MTETAVATLSDPDTRAAIVRAVADGATLSDLLARYAAGLVPHEPVRPSPVQPPQITPEQVAELVAAVQAVAEVYGKVAPTEVRELTEAEQRDLLAEREAIDALLKRVGVLEARKSGGIKHTVSNHLDRLAERTGLAVPEDSPEVNATERDEHGHYLIKQAAPVPGTGKAFSRELRGGASDVDPGRLLAAYEAGLISREQYLAVTREVRVFDAEKARRAIVADPALFGLLAEHASATAPKTAAIYVRKEKRP